MIIPDGKSPGRWTTSFTGSPKIPVLEACFLVSSCKGIIQIALAHEIQVVRRNGLNDMGEVNVAALYALRFNLHEKERKDRVWRVPCQSFFQRYVGGAYWDFFGYHLPHARRSLIEALELVGLKPVEVRSPFLPFTTKSAFPRHSLLVWLYLKVPIVHRVLGQQSWVVAVKS